MKKVIVLDLEDTDTIQALAQQIATFIQPVKSQQPEWVDDLEARTILGGGKKPISKKTLRNYREDGIEHRELGPKSFLYSRSSIMKYIERH